MHICLVHITICFHSHAHCLLNCIPSCTVSARVRIFLLVRSFVSVYLHIYVLVTDYGPASVVCSLRVPVMVIVRGLTTAGSASPPSYTLSCSTPRLCSPHPCPLPSSHPCPQAPPSSCPPSATTAVAAVAAEVAPTTAPRSTRTAAVLVATAVVTARTVVRGTMLTRRALAPPWMTSPRSRRATSARAMSVASSGTSRRLARRCSEQLF